MFFGTFLTNKLFIKIDSVISAESILFNCLHDVIFNNATMPTEDVCRCYSLIRLVCVESYDCMSVIGNVKLAGKRGKT